MKKTKNYSNYSDTDLCVKDVTRKKRDKRIENNLRHRHIDEILESDEYDYAVTEKIGRGKARLK